MRKPYQIESEEKKEKTAKIRGTAYFLATRAAAKKATPFRHKLPLTFVAPPPPISSKAPAGGEKSAGT